MPTGRKAATLPSEVPIPSFALSLPRVALLLALLVGCQPAPIPGKLVIVGMDGLDRGFLEDRLSAGHLPHFARFIDQGLIADLRTTEPILSPIIWTTVASGYPGSLHGVGGWTSANGKPFSGADVRSRRLWDVASAADLPLRVAGWLMTWPASPVSGQLFSDKLVFAMPMNKSPDDPTVAMAQREHGKLGALAWPPSVEDEAMARIPTLDELGSSPLRAQVEAFGAPFHPWTRDETQLRHLEAGKGQDERLQAVYLVSADQVSHLFWPFTDDRVARTLRQDPDARMRAAARDHRAGTGTRAYPYAQAPMTPEDFAMGAAQVPLVYDWLDEALGRVMATVDPTVDTVVVLSDHGFQPGRKAPVLSGGHRDLAVLLAWGAAVRPGATARVEPTVMDMAPTFAALLGLPGAADWTGRVLDELFVIGDLPAPWPTWQVEDASLALDASAPDAADQALLMQLEALGYVDDAGAPVLGASRELGRAPAEDEAPPKP